MFKAVDSPYLVPFDGSFRIRGTPTRPPRTAPDKETLKQQLRDSVAQLSELQEILYAHDRHALLLIFQAMDAAGKDSTIRAVLSGVNPAGCEVYAFKRPSENELDHDFLWRTALCLPQRGRIGVFNRSYYEEVLAVRVHPEYLERQKLPDLPRRLNAVWQSRYESIRDHEKHLAANGTVVIKFWLNVSLAEQRQRFLARLDQPEKNWKFEPADLAERQHWPAYMKAYQDALNATSTAHAPWYAIPADSKPFMRAAVADIIVRTLRSLRLRWPQVDDAERKRQAQMRAVLAAEPAPLRATRR